VKYLPCVEQQIRLFVLLPHYISTQLNRSFLEWIYRQPWRLDYSALCKSVSTARYQYLYPWESLWQAKVRNSTKREAAFIECVVWPVSYERMHSVLILQLVGFHTCVWEVSKNRGKDAYFSISAVVQKGRHQVNWLMRYVVAAAKVSERYTILLYDVHDVGPQSAQRDHPLS